MANQYLLVYTNEAGATYASANPDAVAAAASAEKWGAWVGMLGEHLVNMGRPTNGNVNTVGIDSINGGAVGVQATGFSIISAESLEQASELAQGCPVLLSGGKISVYETLEL